MAKIYIDTTGCSMNFSDSELMMGLLEKEEHEIVDNEKDAEVVILNGCNVKGPTETAFFRKINELKNKKVILTGCVPQSMPEKVADFNVVGTYQLNKITIAVDKTLKGEKFCFLEQTHSDRFDLPKKRVNPVIDIVPINSGCLGACTFCITKKARGILYSYDHKKIISHIKKSASEGVREFWLTSQDTACWGMDKRDNLVNLLKDIVAINGDFKVRLGMGNPNHFKHYIDRLLDIFENEKM
ncbi:MAG: MiaB/RimO family radical SAM methylthiotransferase, partial [Candidatus Woesearchaeota archaeon]